MLTHGMRVMYILSSRSIAPGDGCPAPSYERLPISLGNLKRHLDIQLNCIARRVHSAASLLLHRPSPEVGPIDILRLMFVICLRAAGGVTKPGCQGARVVGFRKDLPGLL